METPRSPTERGYTVLIVDDSREILTLITESLTLLGDYTVLTAQDGADGLEQAVTARPDCAVIDIKMPGLDGFQLVRALRGDSATAAMPLVILTALPQDIYRFAGMLAGADQYLTKPIKPPDLVAAITEAIRLSQTDRHRRMDSLLDQTPPEES
jgi:DNA-binding response OmpR family regulator